MPVSNKGGGIKIINRNENGALKKKAFLPGKETEGWEKNNTLE